MERLYSGQVFSAWYSSLSDLSDEPVAAHGGLFGSCILASGDWYRRAAAHVFIESLAVWGTG